MSEPSMIFNLKNLFYWTVLCIVIYIEIRTARANPKKWPESRRWWLGFDTLFGSGLLMVLWAQYHFWTIFAFAVLAYIFHIARIERALIGNLWDRSDKEPHRWTIQYFVAVLLVIPGIALGMLDLITWAAMFAALGLCGASKVGWTTYLNSLKARKIRKQQPIVEAREATHGTTK